MQSQFMSNTKKMRARGGLLALSLVALALMGSVPFRPQQKSARSVKFASSNIAPATKQRVVENYGKLPLTFEANRGQTDKQVKFLSRGSGYSLFLTANEAVLALRQNPKSQIPNPKLQTPEPRTQNPKPAVVRMRLVGAKPQPPVTGVEELPGKVNYFKGNDPTKWRTNVPTYAKVKYEEVYPGVDLVYYGNQQQLEYDFVVAPGADPKDITLEFDVGADLCVCPTSEAGDHRGSPLRIDANGDLVLRTAGGDIRQHKPLMYQDINGERREISGGYVLTHHTSRIAFHVGSYDKTAPLVIDPVLSYSTFLGRGYANGIAVDGSGNVYLTGPSGGDAFVTKLNPDGSGLVYSTFLGGNDLEYGYTIAVDVNGSAYVSGRTHSSDFPTVAGSFDTTFNGGSTDAFVTRLNADGNALLYSTFLGGSNIESGRGIALDTTTGFACVTGDTASTNFPTTPGAFDTSYNGGSRDAFVAAFTPSGDLFYSTYLGGREHDEGKSIAADGSGNVYLTGWTGSGNFPITAGAFKTKVSQTDVFVTKLNAIGSALVYSTYLGGKSYDEPPYLGGPSIAVDSAGNVWVVGNTYSSNFPTTANAYDRSYNGGSDVFVTKLNASGSGLLYSTFLGGSSNDSGEAIAVSAAGLVYMAGYTKSSNFPVTADAYDSTLASASSDAFLTRLDPTLSGSASLNYSTYFGGSDNDSGGAMAIDSAGSAYVAGTTYSTDFPTTPGAFGTTKNSPDGYSDVFVFKMVF